MAFSITASLQPRRLVDLLLDRLPHTCLVCGCWSDAALCPDCRARFAAPAARCAACALPMPAPHDRCGQCLRHPLPFDAAIAALDYAWPWSGLIGGMKFRQQPRLAAVLADELAAAVRRSGVEPSSPAAARWVLPIPLTQARLRERGYNQAWELARRIGPALGLRADARLLLRLHDAPHQVGLDRAARSANLQGVFAIEPSRRRELAGAEVALVDDVMTTGATLAEAARTLKQAGAARVVSWVVARTA